MLAPGPSHAWYRQSEQVSSFIGHLNFYGAVLGLSADCGVRQCLSYISKFQTKTKSGLSNAETVLLVVVPYFPYK